MGTTKNSGISGLVCFRGIFGLACLLLMLGSSPALLAQNKNYNLCFPNTAWFGLGSPTIDGNIDQGAGAADLGWRGGFRYVFDNRVNGTVLPNATVLGVQDATDIYLGFEFHTAVSNSNDAIMIAYDPTGNVADQRLMTIYPFVGGGTATNVPPSTAPDYYVGGNNFPGAGGSTAPAPAWLAANLRISTSASTGDYLYSVEIKIPLTGTDAWAKPNNPNAGGSGAFGLYLNVIRVIVSGGQGSADEDSWPPPPDTQLATGALIPPTNTTWGVGTVNTGATCNGVSVASISANGGTTNLNLTTDNNFSIVVQNSTVNAQTGASKAVGTAVLAPQIFPTLYLENYGIPNIADLSVKVPAAAGNPAAPHDIPASGTYNFAIGPWNIPAQDPGDLTGPTGFEAVPHRCAVVILDAKPPSTDASCGSATQTPWCYHANIVNNAAIVNMNFPTVSTGKMWRGPIAIIATKGYVPINENEQIFDLQIRTQAVTPQEYRPEALARAAVNLPPQSLIWTAHGYRHTGKTITIHGTTYQIATLAGSFGFGLKYEGAQPAWRYQFFGENGDTLEQPDKNKNSYRMHIPQGKEGYVNATFEGDPQAGSGGPEHGRGGGSHCCGQAKAASTSFASLLGLLAVGFFAHRRSNRNG